MARAPEQSAEAIRAEIFGADRLERHARGLAAAQRVAPRRRRGYPLLARLEENERVLRSAYQALTEAVKLDRAISPAAEWLIDNFHIVDDHIRDVRAVLPRAYLEQLPKLVEGGRPGFPRVHEIVHDYVAHGDSRFDGDALERYVDAYQDRTPLTMGELWAVPIALRLVLLENLRRIAERIVRARAARAEASALAASLLEAGRAGDGSPPPPPRGLDEKPLEPAFAVELLQRLRDADPATMPILEWLESRLQAEGAAPDEVVRGEQVREIADHATVANAITSLRQIGTWDWAELFERVSRVERILRSDPDAIYPQMDFPTRDTYRHAVEGWRAGRSGPRRRSPRRSSTAPPRRPARSTRGTPASTRGRGPSGGT